MTGCPAEDDLVRMVEGALGDASLAQLEAHVDRCERCAEVVAGLGALGRAAGPRTIGRYQLDRRIAAGGMGEVWAAWDPQLRRELAVKLVRPDRADNGAERERLLREARALARLMHPNVLAVHDVGEVDGEVFLATELVVGDTLANRGGASTDWRELVRWYVQAARGLAAAHAAGLVHRDVKPSNLLLGTDGRIRVADFGLAVRSHTPSPLAPTETPSSAGNDPQITAPGMVAGTPAYMAPEQRAGFPADARADQYALCVALAEAIAGRRPPAVKSGAQLIEWVAERRPREAALDALCGVLVLGMAIEPDDRFPDMAALADALEAVDAPARSVALDPTLPAMPIAAAPIRRRRPTWAIAAVAAVISAGGVAAYLATRSSGEATSIAAAPGTGAAGTNPSGTGPSGTNPSGTGPSETNSSGTNPSGRGPSATNASGANRAGTSPSGTNPSGTNPTWTAPGAAPAPRTLTDVPSGRRAPQHVGTVSTPIATATAGGFDFNALHQAGQVAANHRNVAACQAAVAKIPASVPDSAVFAMDLTRATCAMLAGDCSGGRTWAVAAAKSQDIGDADGWASRWADEYCPVTGDLATRLLRLQSQSGIHGDHVEWCDALLPIARAAKPEVKDRNDQARLSATFENLARCYGIVKRCDQAKALWQEAIAVFDGAEHVEPNVPNCDVGHAKKIEIPKVVVQTPKVDPTLQIDTSPAVAAWIELTQRILERHDASGCRAQLAKQPATSDPRVLTAHAACEMVADDCDAGVHDLASLLARQGLPPDLIARTTPPFADSWCPIGAEHATRLRRLASQVSSATGARCTALLQPARDAAADAATDLERRTAGGVLAQLARCFSDTKAGCAQARQVIAEAHDLDPRHDVDRLAAQCR